MRPEQRVRRARSLVLTYEGPTLSGFNFLTKGSAALGYLEDEILRSAWDWCFPADIHRCLDERLGRPSIAGAIGVLLDHGMLVLEGTEEGLRDVEYEQAWTWGPSAGHYHFGIKDPGYMSPDEGHQFLQQRGTTTPPVPLWQTNDGFSQVVELERPNLEEGLLGLMSRRRSYRGFDEQRSIDLADLGDCLFAGMGVTAFADVDYGGRIPLKMTPSGGARNPYEAYVLARRVDGLEPGVYHYSATENTLGLASRETGPTIGEVLGTQPWFDGAAATILLLVHFERTMWKYPHPTGLRPVYMEAGHIAQNMILTAVDRGLTSAPTCAINDSRALALLTRPSILRAVLYSVSLGHPGSRPTMADLRDVVPNEALGIGGGAVSRPSSWDSDE